MIETWQKDVYAIWALCVLRHPSYRNGVSRTRLWELFKEGCHNAYGVRIPACAPLVAYQEMEPNDHVDFANYIHIWVHQKRPLKTFRRGRSRVVYVKLDASSDLYDECFRRSVHTGYYVVWPTRTCRDRWLETGDAVVEDVVSHITPEMLEPGAFP